MFQTAGCRLRRKRRPSGRFTWLFDKARSPPSAPLTTSASRGRTESEGSLLGDGGTAQETTAATDRNSERVP